MHWIFIGAGNMASSLIGGLIGNRADASRIRVVDPDVQTCHRVCERFGIDSAATLADALDVLSANELGVVIAVKPPVVETVCRTITAAWTQLDRERQQTLTPLYISVAAGVRATSMQAWLPAGSAVVRCMPNTPALLGLGATGLYATANCSVEQRNQAQSLLDTAGITLWLECESQLDAVTALSGSGPAYFFYLIEHMTAAGEALGLRAEDAQKLAIETAFGAASMARSGELTPARLRENVTSKGGTTAAALQVFDDRQTPAIIGKAMQAAHDRAVHFGDDFAPETAS